MAAKSNVYQIDTGVQEFEIRDAFGDVISVLRFNPGDPNIEKRSTDAVKTLERILEEEPDTTDKFFEKTDEIEKMFHYLLGTNESDLFKKYNPLTITSDGDTWMEKCLNVIQQIIEKETGARLKRLDKRIKDATAKYNK